MQDNFKILTAKLDGFIKKFYTNLLIKGALLFLSLFLLLFLLIIFLEFTGHYNIQVRTSIFYIFLISTLFLLYKYVAIPVLKLRKIGNTISYVDAAQIIGKYFPEVDDKLLNVLQLKQAETSEKYVDLLIAAIEQKVNTLKPVPFSLAIDFNANKKYLKYALPPVFILVLLLFISPKVVTGPLERIVNHNTYYEKPAPFKITIDPGKLKILQGNDLNLVIKVTGESLPEELFLEKNEGIKYKLVKKGKAEFNYQLKNVHQTFSFFISNDYFKSQQYTVDVLEKPVLVGFSVKLTYPKHTQKNPEILYNIGDLTIPEGTRISWSYMVKSAKKMMVYFEDEKPIQAEQQNQKFIFKKVIKQPVKYGLRLINENYNEPDTILFAINIINDDFPQISVEHAADSIFKNHLYFKGLIRDDYGFSKLNLVIYKSGQTDEKNEIIVPVKINSSPTSQYFYMDYDFSEISKKFSEIECYFQIWDNDAINQFKSTKSNIIYLKAKTKQELDKSLDNISDNLENDLSKMLKDAKTLFNKTENLSQQMNQSKKMDWQTEQQVKDLLQQYNNLEKGLKDFQEKNELLKDFQEEMNQEYDPELQEKMDQLNQLFEELLTPELREQLEELQKLLEQFNKDKMQENLKDLKTETEDLHKALDRNLELFKQLEFEKNLEEVMNKLEELEQKQTELLEKDEKGNREEDSKEQDQIKSDFNNLQKDIEELKKDNDQLSEPYKIEDTEELEKNIEMEMNESSQNLQQNKSKKAKQNQQNAKQGLEQLQESLSKLQDQINQQSLAESIEDLRNILENLVNVSFSQEEVIGSFNEVSPTSPTYQKLIVEQKKILDEVKIIDDSLTALAKRQPTIQSIVLKELTTIKQSINEALDVYQEMQSVKYTFSTPRELKSQAHTNQQLALTSINNLALMLSESLDQMKQNQQQQMKNGQPKGSCKNPGSVPSSKPKQGKMKSLSEMQDALNKQLEALKKELEGKKDGQGMSKQLAKMAYQQSLIRQQMNKLRNETNGISPELSEQLRKMAEEMDKTEKELINKNLNNNTLQRQKDILTRMLESEKSDFFQEKDQKRESKEKKVSIYSNPFLEKEYNTIKTPDTEELIKTPPVFNNFYKRKINNYFINFEAEKK